MASSSGSYGLYERAALEEIRESEGFRSKLDARGRGQMKLQLDEREVDVLAMIVCVAVAGYVAVHLIERFWR